MIRRDFLHLLANVLVAGFVLAVQANLQTCRRHKVISLLFLILIHGTIYCRSIRTKRQQRLHLRGSRVGATMTNGICLVMRTFIGMPGEQEDC